MKLGYFLSLQTLACLPHYDPSPPPSIYTQKDTNYINKDMNTHLFNTRIISFYYSCDSATPFFQPHHCLTPPPFNHQNQLPKQSTITKHTPSDLSLAISDHQIPIQHRYIPLPFIFHISPAPLVQDKTSTL